MQKREYKVLAPIQKANGGEWMMGVGRGYENNDGSLNLYLDALPVSFLTGKSLKLQVRALDEEDLRRREAYRAHGAQAAANRASSITVPANLAAPAAPAASTGVDSIPF